MFSSLYMYVCWTKLIISELSVCRVVDEHGGVCEERGNVG